MKASFYAIIRIFIGVVLIMHGFSNSISMNDYFIEVDNYFLNASIFNASFLKYLAYSIPFLELILGILATAGFFTKYSLVIAYALFFGIAVFLFDAGEKELGLFHTIIATVLFILYVKINYNRFSIDEKFSF